MMRWHNDRPNNILLQVSTSPVPKPNDLFNGLTMIGTTVSHYKIIEKLGEGGMGIVYKAQDMKLDRLVALKFLPQHISPSEAERTRFLQEARAAAALNHPNICTIYGIEEDDDQVFIAMEYVDGKTLRQVEVRSQSLETVLSYARQVAEALQEAHSKGIVHRDIKLENIMINSKNQIKVMDFGLAKLKGTLRLTRTSSTGGTPAYMAPEQIQGGEVDPRVDIFSFGVVFFEMLAGERPFPGDHDAALMYSILNLEPRPLENYRTDVSPDLNRILSRLVRKNPNERYQSFAEVLQDVHRLALALPKTFPSSRPTHFRKLQNIGGLVILFVAIMAGLLYLKSLNNGAIVEDEPLSTVPADSLNKQESRPVPEIRKTRKVENEKVDRPSGKPDTVRLGETLGGTLSVHSETAAHGDTTRVKEAERGQVSLLTNGEPAVGDIHTNSIGMEFVLIPSGTFLMGADDPDAQSDEAPIREVTISQPVWFGKYEVTNAQFTAFVDATNYITTAEKLGWARTWDQSGWTETRNASWRTFALEENLPVVCISWHDAKAFAQWLNETENTYLYRLPTEAEWEFAARSGRRQYKYSWGNGIPVSRKGGNIADETLKLKFTKMEIWPGYYDNHVFGAPVGSTVPNEFGLVDMTGNVWEWCEDWYGPYEKRSDVDPIGPPTGDTRVLRGGSWKESPRYVRCANRTQYPPDYKSADTGFRLVRTSR